MKYSLNWLRDYYKDDISVEKIGALAVALGSDVEEIQSYPKIDKNIIAVKIIKIEPHPNADKLRLPTVFDGESELTIVCGAPNIEVGQIVPLAKVGAKIGDMEIREAEIRGVKSTGMLCSERELGLSDEHTGIKILPDDTELGSMVNTFFANDYILDLEITPNRGDLLSHFGMARDLSAKNGVNLTKPELELEESKTKTNDELEVEIKSENCSLYLARIIKGVKISESPKWLKDKLLSVGAKPINNVVDVTNYIMLDLGHPLHAFDKSKILSSKIEVKEIENEIDITTLDGEDRTLLPGMLGIYDGEKPIAIAGVMGLGNSEVDESTTEIVLEAAVFDRKSIRRTAKLLNLKTEASARFERGIDDSSTGYAIDKAAKLIQEIAGGEILEGALRDGVIKEKTKLTIEYEKINSFADLNLSNEEIDKILESLGFNVESGEAVVPSFRHDISIWQDLAEEVYRMNGIEKIQKIALPEMQKPEPSNYYKKEKVKDYLVEMGLDEAISYTFLSQNDVESAKLDPTHLLEVANPVQEENRYLRNSLIPGLLKAVAKNPSFDDIELFELGNVFSQTDEWTSLAIASSGKSSRNITKLVESLCGRFNFNKDDFKIYEINQEDLKMFKIKKQFVGVAEAKFSSLLKTGQFEDLSLIISDHNIEYRPISKYPPVKRDLAFIINLEIDSDELKKEMLKTSNKVILAEIFDEFASSKLGANKKSVAYHVWLEDRDKTLSDQEADEIISKIIEDLKQKFAAEIRG